MTKTILICIMALGILLPSRGRAQKTPRFKSFPGLPDPEGMAGMFAGVSNGSLFCLGGANFPGKKPWEGGRKVWYADIFRYDGRRWERMRERLPGPLAYGVSVEYDDEVFLIGGNDEGAFHAEVRSFRWIGDSLRWREHPPLPVPLANMAGARAGSLVIVAGGNSGFTAPPLAACYALDLSDPAKGWFRLPDIPGGPRAQAVAGTYGDAYLLFSGEGVAVDAGTGKRRNLLRDAYMLRPLQQEGVWTGGWQRLPDMPRAASASANPVPVLRNGTFVFWGGVDDGVSRHADPSTHPGIGAGVMLYDMTRREWSEAGEVSGLPSRVTLPSVEWRGGWLYVSGEVRPGVRTPTVVTMRR